MLRAGARWMGSLLTGGAMGPPKSLLDNSPLRELLSRVTDFEAMREHVARGDLRALALCATSYFTARSVSFFEAETTVSEWSRAQRHGERVPLSLDYLMASLGIPFLFPPICLHGEYFGDGAMRQTAPLSPAIHLGADRLLVIGVRPTHLDLIPRFVALGLAHPRRDSCSATCWTRCSATRFPPTSRTSTRINRLSAHGRRVHRHAADPHADDRAQHRSRPSSRCATSKRCRSACAR